MIRGREGYIAISYIKPRVVNSVKVCLNCGAPLPKGRQKYCCDECSSMFFIKHNFTLLKFVIFDRDVEEKRAIYSEYWEKMPR